MIFYFTATGNSLYAAQKVQKSTGGGRLVSITEAMKTGKFLYALEENEKAGFVLPVYYYGLPTIVEEFFFKLEIMGAERSSAFLILTCGQSTGEAGERAVKLLLERNLRTDYKFAVAMPDNYPLVTNISGKDEQKEMLDRAEAEMVKIVGILQEEHPGDYIKIKGLLGKLATLILSPVYKNGRHTKKFYATGACIHCGLCERICPVQVISLSGGKPVWIKEQCVHCLACLNRCPVQAIQYGKGTLNRSRYVNPNVTLGS